MRCGPVAGLIACALVLGTAAVPGSGRGEVASVGVEPHALQFETEEGDAARTPGAAHVGASPAPVDGPAEGRSERGVMPARTAHYAPAPVPAPVAALASPLAGASTR